MVQRTSSPVCITLSLILCLFPWTIAAAGNSQPIMLSDLLDAKLQQEDAGTKQATTLKPEKKTVWDILVPTKSGAGIDIIISKETAAKPAASGVIIPWKDLAYDPVKNTFRLRRSGRTLDSYPAFYTRVNKTMGTMNGVLATKLLGANVKDELDNEIGDLEDAALTSRGTMQTLYVDHDHQISSVPWRSANIQQALPLDPAIPSRPVVILNSTKF